MIRTRRKKKAEKCASQNTRQGQAGTPSLNRKKVTANSHRNENDDEGYKSWCRTGRRTVGDKKLSDGHKEGR